MDMLLDTISIQSELLHGNALCINDSHKLNLEKYYDAITRVILKTESVLPRVTAKAQKPYWSENLSNLKRESI